MTEHAHDAQPDEQLDPFVAGRLAAAQAYLRANSPLLTPEARASMLQRIKQQAAAEEEAVSTLVSATPATIPAGHRSLATGLLLVEATGSLLTRQDPRRAQAFADALECEDAQVGANEQVGGTRATDRRADPEQGRILALADALQDVPRPALDPETRTVQRAQLIAAMEAALADGTLTIPLESDGNRGTRRTGDHGLRKARPRSAWSRRLAAGGLTVGVAAGAFGGAAAASSDALPGDSLYGLKRGMEDLRLDLADDDASRGTIYLDLASTRLQEARRLMERGSSGELDDESVGEIRRALSGMQQEASEGHRLLAVAHRKDGSLQPIETLSAFSNSHRKGWTELRDRLPSRLDDVGNNVTSVFDAIEQEVAPLQKLLPPSGGSALGDGRSRNAGTRPTGGTREAVSPAERSTDPDDMSLPPLLPGPLPRPNLESDDGSHK
ncbi:DUF5667 domain-containing protein [Streptomyces sp. NPDC086549]|uniref:DUF5667 domain-containing protein n=1 Tax=Streptomyces sp. NPDC086549 TaxID=3365752 RepID=UPI0037F615A4